MVNNKTGENADVYDYIIVGGGAAGCVLANRLSADPSVSVLLIEAGGEGRGFFVDMPLGLSFVIGNPKFDWQFKSEPEPHLGGREIIMPRGKGLGGSTNINGMVYVRGHAYDFDRWAALGNRGWGWNDVLPYFKRSEAFHRGETATHGGKGEWTISDPGVRWDILDAYGRAASEQGIPATDDYNSGDNEGVAYFVSSIDKGVRATASRAFLRPVRHRPNLAVLTNCLADRLVLEGKAVTGVRFIREGRPVEAQARREVILSAGAFGSPAILQRSGIGPASVLAKAGIAPVHDLAGVGENLQDHWQIRVQHRVSNTKTLNARAGSWFGKALLGIEYLATRRGPLSAQPPLLAAFTRVMPDAPAPDVQIHVSAASYDKVGGPMHPFPGITASMCILRPESQGHVRISNGNPRALPRILNNFLDTELDREIAVRSIELARRIAGSAALSPYQPDAIAPTPEVRSREDMLAYARHCLTTVFHPVGTCKMGHDETAVVNDRLCVRGLSGLRVVDASIMPFIPSGNTAAPTVMVAEKAADFIREDARQGRAA